MANVRHDTLVAMRAIFMNPTIRNNTVRQAIEGADTYVAGLSNDISNGIQIPNNGNQLGFTRRKRLINRLHELDANIAPYGTLQPQPEQLPPTAEQVAQFSGTVVQMGQNQGGGRPGRGDTRRKHMMHVRRANEMRGGVKELIPNAAPYSYAFVPINQPLECHLHDFYGNKAAQVAQAYGQEQEELINAANNFLELRRDIKPVVQMVQNIEEMGKDIEAALTLSNMKGGFQAYNLVSGPNFDTWARLASGNLVPAASAAYPFPAPPFNTGGGYFKDKIDSDIKFLSADLQKRVSPEKFKEFTKRVAKLRALAANELSKQLPRREFQRLVVESDFYKYMVNKENPKEMIVARYSRFVRALFFFYADGSPLPDDFPAV